MLASSVQAVVACNATVLRVCTLVLFILCVSVCVCACLCVCVCVCPTELICGLALVDV